MSFLNSVDKKSKEFNKPFMHWEIDKPLTDEQIDEILKQGAQSARQIASKNLATIRKAIGISH